MIPPMMTPLSVSSPRSASASPNIKSVLCVSLCALALSGCNEQSDYSSLNSPYDVSAAPVAAAVPAETCGRVPAAPVKDLVLGGVYKKTDPTRSEIDEAAQKTYRQKTADLSSFENRVSVLANNYLKNKLDTRSPRCALDWLNQWADGDALLGDMNAQGSYARQWSLASLSSSYLQLRNFPDFEDSRKAAIENWLSAVARAVMDDYSDIYVSTGKQNNHLYWAAWAVTATGLATEKREFYEWGVNKVKYALHVQAQDDGTLPLEMARGKKALQYHIFALAPLVMVSETATRNGEDLYALNDGILHKIVDRVFEGVKDPSYFEKLSGHKQIAGPSISGGHFSWLEVYISRFPDAEKEKFLKERRPVISRRTGGDMTFLYGHSEA
jgi:poly(beta-D-mannuronate) lyase